MPDVVDQETRSRMMSGIRNKDTTPEKVVRGIFYRHRLRYRLHVDGLPGKPDVVFGSRKAAVLIHGCFWHGHDCALFKWPSTRPEFWSRKIAGNRTRDGKTHAALTAMGWRVLIVWECALKGKSRKPLAEVAEELVYWVKAGTNNTEIRGIAHGTC